MNPKIGVIGGSGLYSMPGFEAQEEHVVDTPFGAPSDPYVVGTLAGKQVAFLARHGRGHRISPSELNFRANIYGFKKLGLERIVSLSAVGSLKEEHRPLEFVARDHLALRGRPRTDAAAERPAAVVLLRFAIGHARDLALDAHLTLEFDPMEQQRCMAVVRQFAALAAVVVGEEDEAVGVVALEQHDARGRASLRIGGRQCHRVGLGQARAQRFVEPVGKLGDRIAGDVAFVEALARVFLAQLGDRNGGGHGVHLEATMPRF